MKEKHNFLSNETKNKGIVWYAQITPKNISVICNPHVKAEVMVR